MTELMKQYEAETGKSPLLPIRCGNCTSDYIAWLETKVEDEKRRYQQLDEMYIVVSRAEVNQRKEAEKLKAQLTWHPVSEKPEKGKEVILSYVDCYGHRINVLGSYVRRFDEEAGSTDDEDIMEYSDEKDEYYLKEGWYEHTTHSDYDCWLLHEKIDKWLPIPPTEVKHD